VGCATKGASRPCAKRNISGTHRSAAQIMKIRLRIVALQGRRHKKRITLRPSIQALSTCNVPIKSLISRMLTLLQHFPAVYRFPQAAGSEIIRCAHLHSFCSDDHIFPKHLDRSIPPGLQPYFHRAAASYTEPQRNLPNRGPERPPVADQAWIYGFVCQRSSLDTYLATVRASAPSVLSSTSDRGDVGHIGRELYP